MDQSIKLIQQVGRHDQAIKDLERRDDEQDKTWKEITQDMRDLKSEINRRFDMNQRFVIATLIGVIVDIVLRGH